MKIIDSIKKGLNAKGIDEKYAERVEKAFKVEKEEDVANAVDSFAENMLPAIKEAEDAAKKTADEAAKKAIIEAYEKEHGLKDGKPVEKQPDVKFDGLDPNVKALIESQNSQIAELTKAVQGMVSSQSKSQKLETVKTKMKGKVDEDFLDDFAGRVNLDADNLDAEINTQLEAFSKMQQKFINKAVESGNYEPATGGVSDSDFDGFLKTKSDDTPAFEGVKI